MRYFTAHIVSYSDYYPFGMLMPNRYTGNSEYRYGFQGQESDDEISGESNTISYRFRMHDVRVGRFFTLDPLMHKYKWNSPYAFSENRVIDGIELEGLEYVDSDDVSSATVNDDDTWNVTVGGKTFEKVTVEEIDCKNYFNLEQDVFLDKNGEAKSWGAFGIREKATSDLGGTINVQSPNAFKNKTWPEYTGRKMDYREQFNLEKGCIGVTACFIGGGNPNTTDSYTTIERARREQEILQAKIDANPELFPTNARAIIFSQKFYSADPDKYLPNNEGKVDMSGFDVAAKGRIDKFGNEYTNYDFGFLDETNGRWWHANHGGAGMRIYQSTLDAYSAPYEGFNRQVFSVTFSTIPLIK